MELPKDIKHLYITWMEEDVLAYSLRSHKSALLYTRALEKLRNYTLPVLAPRDLIKVPFIGEKIAGQMEKRLAKYCDENGYSMPMGIQGSTSSAGAKRARDQDAADSPQTQKKRQVKKKKYVPAKRSGGYAIMIALFENDPNCDGMTKDSITRKATPYCDKTFSSNPGTSQFYSAWSSVKTLMNNELVKVEGRPAHYYLTEEGLELARHLKNNDDSLGPVAEPIVESSKPKSSFLEPMRQSLNPSPLRTFIPRDAPDTSSPLRRPLKAGKWKGVNYYFWEPGQYDIRFIVDNREIRSHQERDFFLNQLQMKNVDTSSLPLTVGDGLWVAKSANSSREVVLNYILERKRLDDLASSIKDGRYNEQKVRLKRTGIKNIFYLVEEVTSSDVQQMADAIQTSMSMAMTTSDFHVKRTKDADDTIQFIARTNQSLRNHYKKKTLMILDPRNLEFQQDYKKVLDEFRAEFESDEIEVVHSYTTFDTMLSKTKLMTTRELFIRMLMTIRGVSLEKAIAIQRDFKTPRHLIENFDGNDPATAKKYGKKITELITEIYKK